MYVPYCFSGAVTAILPSMDHFDEKLATVMLDQECSTAICAAI
jgi:hypothetical protein